MLPYMSLCNGVWMMTYPVSPWQYTPQFMVYPQMNANPQFLAQNATTLNMNQRIGKVESDLKTTSSTVQQGCQSTHKIEGEKSTVVIDSVEPKVPKVQKEDKKPKRPEKYLTEKAFYMNQKLKGKLKSEGRILRRRLKNSKRNASKGSQQ